MHDIFCFTDIHGMYDLYKAIINYCIEQDAECSILYLGDACDRGSDGYKIMKELLDNPQVVYLKGNHEDMFTKAAHELYTTVEIQNPERETIEKFLQSCMSYNYKFLDIQNSLYNGSLSTLVDWVMDGMPMDIIQKLEHLPLTFSTDTCDFCHSAGIYNTFKRVANCEYEEKEPNAYDAKTIIWDRNSLSYGWAPNRTAVFGHTPVTYLPSKYYGKDKSDANIHPCKYLGDWDERFTGMKIDMDTGACFTNRAYVLNCLTMQAQGFEMKNDSVKKIEVIQF